MGDEPSSSTASKETKAIGVIITYKTIIVRREIAVQQCVNDQEALNGWRLLCTDAVFMLGAMQGNQELKISPEDLEHIKRLQLAWLTLNTSRKTTLKANRVSDREIYDGSYDGYTVEVYKSDLLVGKAMLEQEKFNVICHKLMTFWGECKGIFGRYGMLKLDDKIEVPIEIDDSYSKDKMRTGIGRWKREEKHDR